MVEVLSNQAINGFLCKACIHIALLRTHNFEGIEFTILGIESKPDCREVTPTQLLQDNIAIIENLTIIISNKISTYPI